MKKLLSLVVFLAVIGGGATVWFWQSAYNAVLTLKDAVELGDVATVEKHADLDAFAENIVDFPAVLGQEAARNAGGDFGAQLAKGFTGLFRSAVQKRLAPEVKEELRAAIADGTIGQSLEPFTPKKGFDAIGDMVTERHRAKVFLAGTCDGAPALLEIDLVRNPEGPLGILGTWRAVGASDDALKSLAKDCLAGAKSSGSPKAGPQKAGTQKAGTQKAGNQKAETQGGGG